MTEATQFLFWEYINGIFFRCSAPLVLMPSIVYVQDSKMAALSANTASLQLTQMPPSLTASPATLRLLTYSYTGSHLLPPAPTCSHLLPPAPTCYHLLPPAPTCSHLLPPAPMM